MDTFFKMILSGIKNAYSQGIISKEQLIKILKYILENYLDDIIALIIKFIEGFDDEEEIDPPGSKDSGKPFSR